MKFQERWDAIWMAITFAEAGDQDTAGAIYRETQRQDQRATERKRPEQRPRPRLTLRA